MGLIFSAACCACQACQCCMSLYNCFQCGMASTRARVQYFTMWVLCSFVAWILRDYGYEGLKRVGGMKECADEVCTGNGMVLRITFSMSVVSAVLAILVFGVQSGSDTRAIFQNDFFSLKWLVLAGTIVGSMWLSNEDAINFAYVSAFGSGLFILFGIVLVLEFAHSWNDSWVEKYDETSSKFWAFLILGSAFILFAGSIAVWGILLAYFGGEGCTYTNAFVSVTIVLSVIVTLISSLKQVTNGAILPSAVMVAYATYLCACAVIDIPDDGTCATRQSNVSGTTHRGVYSAGVIITIFTIGYATIRRASSLKTEKSTVPSGAATTEVENDEETDTEYNYSFFQAVYALGAMYLGMVLINWNLTLEEKESHIGSLSSWTPVWIKMASQWVCFLLYSWTLLAPLIFPDRDFS